MVVYTTLVRPGNRVDSTGNQVYIILKTHEKDQPGLGIRSFAHRSFAHLLILLKLNE